MDIIKEGDILISTEPHSCSVKFVEEINDELILLVDGVRDESYSIKDFYSEVIGKKYRLLCKKEDRKDKQSSSSGYLVTEEDNNGWFKPLRVFKTIDEAKEFALLREEISDLHCWGYSFSCYELHLEAECDTKQKI